jgi:hypothetical protein
MVTIESLYIQYFSGQHLAQKLVGIDRQILEQGRFIERLYFDDDFNIQEFYRKARKNDPDVVGSYEEKFKANNIELRILTQLV